MTTKTEQIFNTGGCPWDNISQTAAHRILFVCTAGLLRSPTCQVAATRLGMNARACGSSEHYALIPMSVRLIEWAHKIVFMNSGNYEQSLDVFHAVGYDQDIRDKAVVWEIEDEFDWGDLILFNIVTEKIEDLKLSLDKRPLGVHKINPWG